MEVNAFVTSRSSPFLLLFVHGDSAGSEGDDHQEAANDRKGLKGKIRLVRTQLFCESLHLEEIVFEEVSHGFVGGDGPPGVEIEVEDVEPGDQH